MEQVFRDFGINPILLAAQVVNFLILLFILKKFLYGPILKVLAQRREKIEQSLKNAEEIERKLLETSEKIDKMMANATSDAQKIMDEAKKTGREIIEEAHQKATKGAENIIRRAEETNKMEMEKMMLEAKGEISGLVIMVLRKLTGHVVTKEEEKNMVEKEIKNLS